MLRLAALTAALAALTAAGQPGSAAAAPVLNATQMRENRANHDRWARTAEKKPAPKRPIASADAGKDAPEEAEASDAPPKHRGELNGKLRMGEW
jgi:hypothetical protein